MTETGTAGSTVCPRDLGEHACSIRAYGFILTPHYGSFIKDLRAAARCRAYAVNVSIH